MSNCFNCAKADVCQFINEHSDPMCRSYMNEHKIIDVPCKIGDEVWAIYKKTHCKKAKVTQMFFVGESMQLCIVAGYTARGLWGQTIFPDENACKESIRWMNENNVETCVCCGEIIPEGRQICPKCENK